MSIEKLREGARILQEADVTNIISSLALGIADAQEQLDNNSIKQVLALADPENGIGGKSLLELGFTPAFYHFQHADVSAAISLRMKKNEEFEFAASLKLDYAKAKGYSSEDLDLLEEKKKDYQKYEFKSQRSFMMNNQETKIIEVDNQSYEMNQTLGSVSKIEDFSNQLRQAESVSRVDREFQVKKNATLSSGANVVVNNKGGYVTIAIPEAPTVTRGLLRINPLHYGTAAVITVDTGDTFTLGADFAATVANAKAANGGTVTGIEDSGFRIGANPNTLEKAQVRFDHDARKAEFDSQTMKMMRSYLKVLEEQPDAKVSVDGYTDGTGGNKYNEKLSQDRREFVAAWFEDRGISASRILGKGHGWELAVDQNTNEVNTNSNPDFRIATLTLIADFDFIFFEGGDLSDTNAAPVISGSSDSGFAWTLPSGTTPTNTFTIEIDGESVPFSVGLIGEVKTEIDNNWYTAGKDYVLQAEVLNDTAYLMHKDTNVTYSLYSEDSEEIKVSNVQEVSSNAAATEDTYFIDENLNSKTVVKKDAENIKNPSTFAVGATVDVRVARQFEMEVEGNSSVSARLVSLPAPAELLDFIRDSFNPNA